jgi:hypothetical protein
VVKGDVQDEIKYEIGPNVTGVKHEAYQVLLQGQYLVPSTLFDCCVSFRSKIVQVVL